MQRITIVNRTRIDSKPLQAVIHNDFWGRLVGLMFREHLSPDGSIIIDQKSDSRIGSAIHMLFMNFQITAIWVNKHLEVTDVKIAKPWAFAYVPKKPSRYIIETYPELSNQFQMGDQLEFIYE